MAMSHRNKCYLEVHFGRAQWVATDDEITAKEVVLMLLASGQSHSSIRIRTGDDRLHSPKWKDAAERIARKTGITYIY
jgi:hypothetical protein